LKLPPFSLSARWAGLLLLALLALLLFAQPATA